MDTITVTEPVFAERDGRTFLAAAIGDEIPVDRAEELGIDKSGKSTNGVQPATSLVSTREGESELPGAVNADEAARVGVATIDDTTGTQDDTVSPPTTTMREEASGEAAARDDTSSSSDTRSARAKVGGADLSGNAKDAVSSIKGASRITTEQLDELERYEQSRSGDVAPRKSVLDAIAAKREALASS